MEEYKLSHLKELEAESIHIIREVAAEFENPVMLYSIGKDSSVMVLYPDKTLFQPSVPLQKNPFQYYKASPDSQIPPPLRG